MRKLFKRVATVAATVGIMAAMTVSAFADEDSTYSFVGNPYLFGSDNFDDNSTLGWCPTSEEQIMTAVDGMEGVYSYTGNAVKSSADALAESDGTEQEIADSKGQKADHTLTFKILKDATDFAWNYQMQIGNPDAAWGDNKTQFRATSLEAGEYTVYVNPTTGYVCIIQNGKNVDIASRFNSRDEDSWNYVDTTEAAFKGDGYDDIGNFTDDAYLEFINSCLENEGAEPIEYVKGNEGKGSGDDASTTDSSSSSKKSSSNKKSEEKESSNATVIIIVVVVVAIIAACAVVLGKKKK